MGVRKGAGERTISRRAMGALLLAPCASALSFGCRRPGRGGGAEPSATIDGVAPGSSTRVEVDFASTVGAFHRLSGVQGSPHPVVTDDIDHRDRFRAHHIEHARFPQDCPPNVLTLGGVFPEEDADPSQPQSYRFAAIDRHVCAARAAGASILWQSSYDVGKTDRWMGLNLGGRAPEDLTRWSQVVTKCLEHFNDGWADGHDYSVENVEFVNEPNGLGGFRGAKLGQIIPAFSAFLRTIAAYNAAHPNTPVKAVGPGIPFCFLDWPLWQPRFTKLLESLATAGLKLPVFSFHTYGKDTSPLANARLARALRDLLDEHGMERTELWNTEWQGGDFLRKLLKLPPGLPPSPSQEQLRLWGTGQATYALSCKIRWQGLLSGSYYYRANMRAFGRERLGRAAGRSTPSYSLLFSPQGEVRPLALQELLTSRIARHDPQRCKTQWPDDGSFAALGLRGNDRRTAAILLCNLSTEPRGVELHLRGLPRAKQLSAKTISLTAERVALVEQTLPVDPNALATNPLRTTLPPLGSRLVVLTAS